MPQPSDITARRQPLQPSEILIAGGGVAALEAAFALHELAADHVNVRLLAPDAEFVYRPNAVKEPFSLGSAGRYKLDTLAAGAGAQLIQGALARVDVDRRVAYTAAGSELPYDALLLALGARLHERYAHVTTVDDARMDEYLHGLVQDVEEGYVKRLAFVIAAPMAWPLPIYELAFLTAERAWDMQAELAITILTPEAAPLAVLGVRGSQEVEQLLSDRAISVITSVHCEIPQAKTIDVTPGDRRLEFDRIVALPQLRGPALAGVPHDAEGFIPVDEFGLVGGAANVFAAGDATDFPIKHGGLAAQQADVAAMSIAARSGALVEPQRIDPVLEAVLLTGGRPRYFRAHLSGGHGSDSEVAGTPTTSPPPKIAARYLADHLEAARSTR